LVARSTEDARCRCRLDPHLVGELFKSLAGTPEIAQVPYRGAGPVITDLISGQIPMGVVGVTGQVLEFHRSGKLRVLAAGSPSRLTAASELPTVAEAEFPGLTSQSSVGLLAPARTRSSSSRLRRRRARPWQNETTSNF
jgi:tripartite-type tricarboxylate transporter receptor subunit TctC